MDCGPRNQRLCLDLRRMRCSHVTCKKRTPREFSPTGRKKKERARLNREAPNAIIALPSPQCYQSPLYPWALHLRTLCHVAPHTGANVDRPRGLLPRVSATCAPRGLPRLCHVASVPRRTPGRSRVPRQPPPRHVSTDR